MGSSQPIYALKPQDVYKMLETSPDGLSSGEVEIRRGLYGLNILSAKPHTSVWKKLVEFVGHPMALLLWGAGLGALFTNHVHLGVIILLIIVINSVFSFWREYRATKAVEVLRRLLPVYARVVRAGEETRVPVSEIVPGDVLILAEGDNVPADARVVEEFGLRVNNAVLTGETMPARKTADESRQAGMTEIERPNLIYAGTSIFSGTVKAVVFSTGMLTQFGRIANLTQAVKEEHSLLQQQMMRISRIITFIALLVGFIVFSVSFFDLGTPTEDALLMAIGIIVAVVPEGLISTVTLTLAIAVQRLAQKKVLVKKLASVETLGAVSVVCTDKSGTLTQNQMTVRRIWVGGQQFHISGVGYDPRGDIGLDSGCDECWSQDLEAFYRAAFLCNNSRLISPNDERQQWTCLGDQTEAALLALSLKAHLNEEEVRREYPRIHEIPFEARRKRMSTIHRHAENDIAIVKGAPKEVLQLCSHVLLKGELIPLNSDNRSQILAANDEYARGALRVLALAQRELPSRKGSYLSETVEHDLTFLGLAGMMDPPRPEVARAMSAFHSAGIRVAMITGDYGLTAESIARRIGMLKEKAPLIITGAELDELNDDQLIEMLNKEIIFARMAPEHKLRLVSAFQQKGEVVAVIGDGVNDAPALRKADIGIAMGVTGTDVAREAADIILTQDEFDAVTVAIEEGRAVFDNLRKFLTYILASNVPEIFPFILTALFHIPLALTVIQILAIDLGSDLLPAIALGMEKPEPDVMKRPPRKRGLPLLDKALARRAFIWLGGIEVIFCYLAFILVYDNTALIRMLVPVSGQLATFFTLPLLPPEQKYLLATSMFNAGVVTAQVGNLFACRSEKSYTHQLGWLSNPLLWPGIAVEIGLILLMIYIPSLASIFHHYPIPVQYWLILGLFAPGLYAFDRLRKMAVRSKKKNGTIP
jgi:P-type Ca2+ transporter type 2C